MMVPPPQKEAAAAMSVDTKAGADFGEPS
eukprot:SAG31_NODE_33399_length_344_cov_0.836735_1_plen_28_part_01